VSRDAKFSVCEHASPTAVTIIEMMVGREQSDHTPAPQAVESPPRRSSASGRSEVPPPSPSSPSKTER